jgi:hypothetical protein
MYAKVIVNIRVSPHSGNTYTITKIICKQCDSSLIKSLKIDAINIAKEKGGLKTLSTQYGESTVDYVFPIYSIYQRKGKTKSQQDSKSLQRQ